MGRMQRVALVALTAVGTVLPVLPLRAELSGAEREEAAKMVAKASEFLRGVQAEDGSFADGDLGPPITAIVLTGLLKSEAIAPSDPMAQEAIDYLLKHAQKDGGIYTADGRANYSTAISVMALGAARSKGDKKLAKKLTPTIDAAVAFLKDAQWDESEGIDSENVRYGGAGYGGKTKTRPDLSNTAFLLEAFDAAGLPKDDPAYARALLFVRRCQNLSGEGANDLPQAKLVDDGGFYYTPAEDYNPGGGEIAAGLRSYASMTYAGLKSFLYAGVDENDFRVKAATDWVAKHYSLDENPGMGQQGLYYYYHTFAKALDALGGDTLVGADGTKHDWRSDLIDALAERQADNGSWQNPTTRWLEGDPRLVTGYALMALGAVVEDKE